MSNNNTIAEYVRYKGMDYFLDPSEVVIDCFKGIIYDNENQINLNLLYRLAGMPI